MNAAFMDAPFARPFGTLERDVAIREATGADNEALLARGLPGEMTLKWVAQLPV